MKAGALAVLMMLTGCATSGGSGLDDADDRDDLASAMRPYASKPDIVVSGALGSETNPVRVHMPEGEREYLHRLRCQSGNPPMFERQGSTGLGPYNKIMDIYELACGDKSFIIYMDMYHCVEEDEPVPGFEIVPEIGRREKEQCE